MSDAPVGFVSGFVTLIGRPNSGKSTLLNALLGAKLAITSDKPQTTWTAIQGVVTDDRSQIVFIDTPGIHKPVSALNRRMMDSVRAALEERDLLLYLTDATKRLDDRDREALRLIEQIRTPVFLVLNKIDRLKNKQLLLPLIESYRAVREFAEYFPVSALTVDGVAQLKERIRGALPQGPAYFPPDHLTDQPERFLAAELIREKIIRATHQEVPHSVAVLIEKWEDLPDLSRVSATIVVERAGQKAILIGSKGAMLKQIGTEARLEMEHLLGRRFFLELFVKVREGWRDSQAFLNDLDYQARAAAGVEAGGPETWAASEES